MGEDNLKDDDPRYESKANFQIIKKVFWWNKAKTSGRITCKIRIIKEQIRWVS